MSALMLVIKMNIMVRIFLRLQHQKIVISQRIVSVGLV
jgi:hypothetical protein